MEATFVLKSEELTPEWLEQLKSRFASNESITITASGPERPISADEQRIITQRQLFKRMEALRERTSRILVTLPPGTDINDIIDGVNDMSL